MTGTAVPEAADEIERTATDPPSTDRGSPLPRYPVLGTPIAAAAFEEVLDLLASAPGDGRRLHVHFCTVHSIVEAADDPILRAVFGAADSLAVPDGVPLVWVGRARGQAVERVCGPDMMPALIARTAPVGARHYFYGGAPGVAERLAERFSAAHPGLVVAGTSSPPFRPLTPEEDAAEIAAINATQPDYVWVGLGAPKQDLWAARQRPHLDAAVILAVGAAFDFHSGGLKRAPAWMQRHGLEWVFRLWSEPRRLARRYLVTNTRFVALLARDAIARRLGGSPAA
ncbi:MAG: WecB/TagA/CpsF family glycosyltransferase [Candidatus Limnocylindria bacterium]